MKKLLKNNIKVISAFILGLVIAGSIGVYAVNVASSDVTYDNTNSGSSATTVSGALDDLYTKITNVVADCNYIYSQLVSELTNYNNTLDCRGFTKMKASLIGAYGQGSYVSDGYVYKSSITVQASNSTNGPWTSLFSLTVSERSNVTIDFTGYRYIKISSSNPFGSTKIRGISFE